MLTRSALMCSLNAIVFTLFTSLEERMLQSLCENCHRQSCKAFISITIRAKMIGGGNRFYLKC